MPQMAMSKRILLEMHFIAEDYTMKSIPLDKNDLIPFGIMAKRCNTTYRCLNRPSIF